MGKEFQYHRGMGGKILKSAQKNGKEIIAGVPQYRN